MKRKLVLLLFFTLTLGAASLPEFYLWQRSWTPSVREAAEQCGRPLAVLAAELDAGKTFRSEAPAVYWQKDGVTAVFRLRVGALNPGGFERLAAEAARTGCARIELDIDVPARRLAEYAEYLKQFRKTLPPGTTLSVTVLPSHLVSPAFQLVAAQTDFYVLQLHGLNVPQHIGDEYRLIDPVTARRAIVRARAIGIPFKIALPTYAYVLSFEPETGKFAAISAEGALPPAGRYLTRLAAPDLKLLRNLIAENPDLAVIWFRLPVADDRFCYDRATLGALERGELPSPLLTGLLRRVGKNALELWITPRHRLQLEPLKLKLEWKNRTEEFELSPGVDAATPFAVLPESVTIPFPGCGRAVRVGTFFVDRTNHSVIQEILP